MAFNDLTKQSGNPVLITSQRYARVASAARGRVGQADEAHGVDASGQPTKLTRLARPTRKSDFYLADEGSEPARHKPALDGLSAPKAHASRAADAQTPPEMDVAAKAVALPRVEQPRAMTLSDVQGDAKSLGKLAAHFNLVEVKGDGFASLVAALLHHGASFPQHGARLAEGLRSFEEPTGEISPEVHAGFAMLKRWAQALQDGRGTEAKTDALKHPAAIAAIALALRGIVRHMQVFGVMKRPAKSKAGRLADMEALHALADACGLKLVAFDEGVERATPADGSALHVLAHSTSGHWDVLVPKV